MKITVYERTQGRTIVIYLQLERAFFKKSFNQHVLKRMEKMFWPFAHQDSPQKFESNVLHPHFVQFDGKANG